MNIKLFSSKELNWLYRPKDRSVKEDNGQLTIIGGSSLFHGAPILALKTASRIVDMVFFASPEPSLGRVAEKIKSQLASFIWVPLGEVEEYIKKSDAVLIGPGLMRFRNEKDKKKAHLVCDEACQESKQLTESLVKRFSKKQWVIDGGSLQTMGSEFISRGAILTPNQKEFRMLFSAKDTLGVEESVRRMARKYNCIIVLKGPTTIVCSPDECVLVKGGNAGLTKGGSGDVLAGLTVALAAKNEPLLAACAASWIVKKAADELYKKVGFAYNADDLAEKVPGVLGKFFT